MNYLKISLAVLLVTLSAQSYANSRAEATLSGLRYTLIDLDPNDGIAPSLTINTLKDSGYLNIFTSSQNNGSDNASGWGQGTEPLFRSASIPVAAASGSIVGRDAPSAEITSGTASIMENGSNDPYKNAYVNTHSSTFMFSLSPKTTLVFSLDIHLALQTDDITGEHVRAGGGGQAWVYTGSDWELAYDTVSRTIGGDGLPQATLELDQVLNVTLENNRMNGVSGSFSFGADIEAKTVSPVPEPATYGMLLAGLGIAALAAHRRETA